MLRRVAGRFSSRARHRASAPSSPRPSPDAATPWRWWPGGPTASRQCATSASPPRPDTEVWAADLSEPEAAAHLALQVWDHYGGIDVLVNNAAVPMRRHVTRLTMAEVERTMRINYFSPVAMSLALLPRMLERSAGTIVNVSSLGGRLGITAEAAYSGSKFALAGWSESMVVDLDGTGVSVKLIIPGAIDTEIWDQPDNDAPLYDGPKEPPEAIAAGIVAAIDSDTFEHYLPDMKAIIEAKTSDIDSFIVGMRGLGGQEGTEQ